MMRNRRISFVKYFAACISVLCCAPALLLAQTSAPKKPPQTSSQVPDLSGNWAVKPGGTSWDPADPNGSKPEHLPMTPWALERLRAAKPPFGANQSFDPNDPHQRYCDPPGTLRMCSYPWQFTIVQTPAQVYVLFEYLHVWRMVTMNQAHPKD